MLTDALSVTTIFFLVPAIIGCFAYWSYRDIVKREKENAANKQKDEE